MLFIKILFYLFILLFFSNVLNASSMHFDCKCDFGHYTETKYTLINDFLNENATRELRTANCADMHLEIKLETKQIRIIDNNKKPFIEDITITDIGFLHELNNKNYYQVMRFDRYTVTFTITHNKYNEIDKIRNTKHEVFRCEKIDKKY